MSVLKRPLMRAAVIAVATLAAAVAAEAFGQTYFRTSKGHWLWEDGEFKANNRVPYYARTSDRRQYALKPGFHDDRNTIDSRGFRVTDPIPGPDDRVVVNIGDSVVFGTGVKDQETYSAKLAAQLKTHGLHLGVLNAGVPSYATRQSFDRLHMDVERFYPPSRIAAVTFNAANDISLVFYYNANYSPELTWARERQLIPMRPAWHRIAAAYYLAKADAAYAQHATPAPTRDPEHSAERRMLDSVRATLRSELAIWRERHVPVVLLPINPFNYQLAHDERNADLRVLREIYNGKLWEVKGWDPLVRQFNDMLRQTASEFPNAHYVETRAIFDEDDRDTLYLDYLHFNPRGHARMAEILFEYLESHHLLADRE